MHARNGNFFCEQEFSNTGCVTVALRSKGDIMHAVKGGWVGPTFALARGNGSEGRKSRIRRSKEERKALVESFIKK